MDLEDLLALLPDNTSGDISAEDLRTVVTALWNKANLISQVSEGAPAKVASSTLIIQNPEYPTQMTILGLVDENDVLRNVYIDSNGDLVVQPIV